MLWVCMNFVFKLCCTSVLIFCTYVNNFVHQALKILIFTKYNEFCGQYVKCAYFNQEL